jgi:hypothetical protein
MRNLSKEMATPLQRLARMHKSFDRDKRVLAEGYKYFTTPVAPAMQHVSIPWRKAVQAAGIIREDALKLRKTCWEDCAHV